MSKTKIAWATDSINPIRVKGGGHHCTKISVGCQNCYAEKRNMNPFYGGNKIPYDNRNVEYELNLSCFDKLPKTKPAIVFVQSMSDLFHDDVPPYFQERVIDEVQNYPQHKFLMLTKRPKSMTHSIIPWSANRNNLILPNLWLGVTVEHPDYLWRIEKLLQIPAAVRFVSFEPLLASIDFGDYVIKPVKGISTTGEKITINNSLHWVVVGAESGSKRRECRLSWVRDIITTCYDADIRCFVKQIHINGKVSHNMNEWPEDLRVQEWPA